MAFDWKKAVKPAHTVAEFKKPNSRVPKTAIEVVMASIDKQIELFKKPSTEGRKWFEVKGDNVAFAIRYSNKPLKLVDDETLVVVPKAQFVEVLTAIKADVEKGAFKSQLDELEAGVKKRVQTMAATRASKGK